KYHISKEKTARRISRADYPAHDFDGSYSDRKKRQTNSYITEPDSRFVPKIMKMIPRSRSLEPRPQILSVRIPVLPECLISNAPNGMFLHHLFSHIPKFCSVRQVGAFSSELQGRLKQFVAENNKEAAQYHHQ